MKHQDTFDVSNHRGWYAVRYYVLNRPNEVKWYDTLLLDGPVEVRTRGQWNRFLGQLMDMYSGMGDPTVPVVDKLQKFLQNYVKKYHQSFPGVYSIGPFETRERAREAITETAEWWEKAADKFLGPEGVEQFLADEGTGKAPYYEDYRKPYQKRVQRPLTSTVLGDGRVVSHGNHELYPTRESDGLKEQGLRYVSQDPELDWLQKREKTHWEIMDVTEEPWVTYPSLTDAAKALGVQPAEVYKVCKGTDGRKQIKGRVLRFADPAGYGVPVRYVRYTRRNSRGEIIEDVQLEPDYETINPDPDEPTGGYYRTPEPAVPSPVDWDRKDRVRFTNLIRL